MLNGLCDAVIPKQVALVTKSRQLLLEFLDLVLFTRLGSRVSLVEVRIVPHDWIKGVGCRDGENADASRDERDRPISLKICRQMSHIHPRKHAATLRNMCHKPFLC